MKKLIIMGLAVASLGLTACSSSKAEDNSYNIVSMFSSSQTITASRHYVSKSISLKDFNALETVGSFNVEYKHDNRPHAELYMPDNVLPYLDLAVSGKKLTLSMKNKVSIRWGNNSKAKIVVYAPSVNDLSLIGSGSLLVSEPLQENKLKLRLTGSGDIKIRNAKANTVDAVLVGSGDFDILALDVARKANLNLSGSGDFNVAKLKAQDLTLSTAGSGDFNVASITADNVTASVAGSGDMHLRGAANTAAYSVTGSGDIDAGGLKVKDLNAGATGSGEITCYATGKTSFHALHTSSIRNLAH